MVNQTKHHQTVDTNSVIPKQRNAQHEHHHHLAYTGLATITLLGGLGTTPVTMANAATKTQTEKIVTNQQTKVADKSTKAQPAIPVSNHVFTADEFNYDINNDGTRTITGFNTANFTAAEADTWDGILAFPAALSQGADKVTGIKYQAFTSTGALTQLDLSALPSLVSIGHQAFSNCSNLNNINFANLSNLTLLDSMAFSGSAITEVDLSPLDSLTTIVGMAFTGISAIIGGPFADCQNLTTVNLTGMDSLTSINGNAFQFCVALTTLTLADLPALTTVEGNAFPCGSLTDLNLTNLPSLATLDYAFPGTTALHQITINAVNPDVSLDDTFADTHIAGIIVPVAETDVPLAQRFAASINTATDNKFTGAQIWFVNATLQYSFIDQDGQPITVDANNNPVVPLIINGPLGSNYTIPTPPTIAGYGAPTVVSGTATGTYTFAPQEVVYQYHATAQPFMVYLVDDAGNELKTQQYSGFADEDFTVTPPTVPGYTFKELYTRPATNNARAVITELSWVQNDALKDTSVKFGANNGNSYKFVYTKNGAGSVPETPAPTTPPTVSTDQQPTISDTDTNNTPVIPDNPDNVPAKLPSSGADNSGKTPLSTNTNVPTPLANTPTFNYTPVATSETVKNLPKSGNVTNYLLPALGATLLAGLAGLYALTKKRKS